MTDDDRPRPAPSPIDYRPKTYGRGKEGHREAGGGQHRILGKEKRGPVQGQR
jgi:hypothetical protein